MNNGKIFAGFAIGALAGAALSCFAHSNRGHQLRKNIHRAIHDLKDRSRCFQSCDCGEECECTEEQECQKQE